MPNWLLIKLCPLHASCDYIQCLSNFVVVYVFSLSMENPEKKEIISYMLLSALNLEAIFTNIRKKFTWT